ncbi:zinc finger, C2H2 type [Cooperia oncophora]
MSSSFKTLPSNGINFSRCFTKAKFEIEEDEPKCQPPVNALQVAPPEAKIIKIESDVLMQTPSLPTSTNGSPDKAKQNEFSVLVPHITCPHCTFSGRTFEFIEKHRRLHQTIANITPPTPNTPPAPIHMPSMVLVPVSNVPTSLIPLTKTAPVITVSLNTVSGGQITIPTCTPLPISFASVLKEQPLVQPPVVETPAKVEEKPKCPPRRSATEPSLRFIGSDGVKRRRCPLCPYVSKFSCDMRSHMEMHALNARFKCSQCSYSTKRAVSLRSHIALHTEDNAMKAKRGKPINIVVQKVQIGVKRGRAAYGFYCCAHCPFVTRICAELWKHARRHIGASKRFNCSLCSFSSVSLDVMEEHQLLHPERSSIYPSLLQTWFAAVQMKGVRAGVCPFKTTVYQRMWNHKQKHKKTAKFVCSKCTFSTGSEMCLEDHMIVHSEPNSAMDTGTAPSRSQSADGIRKSGSDEVTTPDSQKASMLDDRYSFAYDFFGGGLAH